MQSGLIQALCEKGHLEKAVAVLSRLDTAPSLHTYLCLLKACTHKKALLQAKQVQAHLSQHSIQLSGILGDYLVVTLARCGAPDDALVALHSLPCRTVFSWTAIISAYADVGYGLEVLRLYKCMLADGIKADRYTFVSLFKACGNIPDLELGMHLHVEADKKGFTSDVFVSSTLVSMYGKCNALAEAENVFAGLSGRTVVSWNAMLSAYVEQGHGDKALQLFVQMQANSVSPYYLTSVIALQACVTLLERQKTSSENQVVNRSAALEIGVALHADTRRKGLSSEIFVGSALITMYGKSGEIAKAEHVFAMLPEHSLVSWTALLSMYVDQGHVEKALQFYREMEKLGAEWDHVTLTCVLQACGATGSLETCKQLHFGIVSVGYDEILPVAATLIHSYGSCAYMVDVQACFDGLVEPTIVVWNACIAGHAVEGNSPACLCMFENLSLAGMIPNGVTFNSALCACSHSGLVTKGFEYFESMSSYYGLSPDVKHYGSMLDLLGRAGDFKMIDNVLGKINVSADLSIWLCLLGACRAHGNVELARKAFDHAVALQPKQDTAYVVMSRLYADAGLWESVEEVESCRERLNL